MIESLKNQNKNKNKNLDDMQNISNHNSQCLLFQAMSYPLTKAEEADPSNHCT